MGRRPKEEEFNEVGTPTPEELGRHAGQVIAFDDEGRIQEATTTWPEMMERLGERLGALTIMYVPTDAIVG